MRSKGFVSSDAHHMQRPVSAFAAADGNGPALHLKGAGQGRDAVRLA